MGREGIQVTLATLAMRRVVKLRIGRRKLRQVLHSIAIAIVDPEPWKMPVALA